MIENSEPTLILLGAGASVEAGIPASFEMSEKLAERIGAMRRWDDLASALNFVSGALLAYDAAEGKSPFGGLDVERVFAAVRLLAERQTLEVSPFVAAWHPAVDAWDRKTGTPPGFFDRDFRDAILGNRGGVNPGAKLITQLVRSVTTRTDTGRTYKELAERMLAELRALVATTPKRVQYLAPLVRQAGRSGGLTIATLNYDISVELAGESAGITADTGIDRWVTDGRWVWADRGVRLLKLHGSIDWVWETADHVEGQLPRRVLTVTEDPGDEYRPPVVVFGQREKLTAEGPFLSLLAEFEGQLSEASRLLAVGYSFRDDHVNELIRRWTAEDLSRRITVIDPGFPEGVRGWTREPTFREQLTRYLVPSGAVPDRFPARLNILREPASVALAKLFGADA